MNPRAAVGRVWGTRTQRAMFAVFAGALGLRLAVAAVDARKPLFPSHYYNDERDYLAQAEVVNAGLREGRRLTSLTPGKELHIVTLAALSRRFGDGPLPGRALNAATAAASAVVWGWVAAALTTPAAGLGAAAFLAFWPSHVFHTSLAGKEGPIGLMLSTVTALFIAGLSSGGFRRQALWAGAAATALALGLLRAYLPSVLAAAGAVAALAAAAAPAAGRRRAAVVPAALWLAAGAAGFKPLKAVLSRPLLTEGRVQSRQVLPSLPAPPGGAPQGALSVPARLGAYRNRLHAGARTWSLAQFGAAPDSALFPDEEIATWTDLALFVPRATFYELFMPLPGLYPTQGKPARMLASAEGVALLAVALLAAAGLSRRRWDAPTAFLCAFVAVAAPATAFLEFDLGSASRHRTHFYPFVLPFAAAAALGAARRGPR